jgi:nucleoid-associated protein YgaU
LREIFISSSRIPAIFGGEIEMVRLVILILLLITLAACSGRAAVPTLAPTAPAMLPDADDSAAGASPRVTPNPGLPPTWTPQPTPLPATAVPMPTPQQPGEQTTYVVQRGDTLAEIALRFGVSLTDLARLNNIENVDRIEVGQVLVIPAP